MQRLIAFFENNSHVLLFLFLQAVCFYLLFSLNPYQKAYFTTSVTAVTGRVNSFSSGMQDYFDLANQNQALQEDFIGSLNSNFNNKLYYLGDTITIKDSTSQFMFSSVPAQVVYNTVHKAQNIFVINKGSVHGIEPEMGVVSAQGVAGKVLDVGKEFSVVMSVLNTKFKFAPKINNLEYFSNVEWQNTNNTELAIEGINNLEKIKVGDYVKTGKNSLIFPPNIPIGVISSLETSPTNQYFKTRFKTTTNFRDLEYVFVLRNNLLEDIQEIMPIE